MGLECCPESCILHLELEKTDHTLLSNLLIAAKLLIAQKWKTEDIPTIHDWRFKCQYILLMHKLTTIRKGKDHWIQAISKFMCVWEKFILYFNQVRLQDNLDRRVLEIL